MGLFSLTILLSKFTGTPVFEIELLLLTLSILFETNPLISAIVADPLDFDFSTPAEVNILSGKRLSKLYFDLTTG